MKGFISFKHIQMNTFKCDRKIINNRMRVELVSKEGKDIKYRIYDDESI